MKFYYSAGMQGIYESNDKQIFHQIVLKLNVVMHYYNTCHMHDAGLHIIHVILYCNIIIIALHDVPL